jgi:hypothetical protein
MSTCTDTRLGDFLHAYELNQLDDPQRDAFELHLLSCRYCFEQASRFDAAASLLRADADVRGLVAQAATDAARAAAPEPHESLGSRLRRHLWPETNLFLRPALAYFLILVLAYPAYRGLQPTPTTEVRGVRSLVFSGTRTTAARVVDAGAPLVVMFRISGAREGQHFRVVVRRDDGTIIYTDDDFTDFNEREMGTLLLGERGWKAGRYHIEVYAPDAGAQLHRYSFQAE